MLSIITLAVAGGTVGTVATVVTAQQQKKKRQKSYWHAEWEKRQEWFLRPELKKRQKSFSLPKAKIPSSLRSLLYREQINDISSKSDEARKHEAEEQLKRDFYVTITSLGIGVAGRLFWAPLAVWSLPGMLYVGLPWFKTAFDELLYERVVSIDTLSVITLSICLFKEYYVLTLFSTLLYVGSKKLLIKIKDDSQKSIIDVFRQHPRTVWLLKDGIEVEMLFEELEVGDIVVVHTGEMIPIDGTIRDGMASIDQHVLTGEAQLVEKGPSEAVFASTVVLAGQIYIEVEKTGEDTTVAQIGTILNQTASYQTNLQLRAKTMTDKTVLPTLMVAAFCLPVVGAVTTAALLNTHFGYRMLVTAPIGILTFLHVMSQYGILVKDGRTLDFLTKIDTVVFDKTGTLTQQQPYIGQIYSYEGYHENEVLAYAAAAEYKQSHPIALAIIEEATTRQLDVPLLSDVEYKVGFGLSVTIDEELIRVGSIRFMKHEGIIIPPSTQEAISKAHAQGHSLVMVAREDKLIGAIELLPTIRPEALRVIQALRELGIESMYIISGDQEAPTRKLAHDLGIDHYYAETLPQNKAEIIEELQRAGKTVCYVGDGINDAIALKKAHISISLSGASTAATDTAQIILMDESLSQLPHLFELAHEFDANLKTSFSAIVSCSLMTLGGVCFLNFGLLSTILLKNVGLVIALANSMLPRLKHQKRLESLSREGT